MKKYFLFALLILFVLPFSYSQDLNDILKNYYDGNGSEKLKEVKTITMKGKSSGMGMETEFVTYFKRPGKMKLEVDVMGSKMVQAYDGTTGWMIAPWTGSTEPQDLPAVAIKQIKEQADFDGQLVDYKEKGYDLEMIGKEDLEGTPVYKLKLTNVKEGDITYYYIDADNYVVIKTSSKINMEGNEVEVDTYYSNYKKYKGIYFPYQIESKSGGQTQSNVIFSEITFDEPIEDDIFLKPKK